MEKSLATRDTNYQLLQSQIAVGAGGPLGVGLGDGCLLYTSQPRGGKQNGLAMRPEGEGGLRPNPQGG